MEKTYQPKENEAQLYQYWSQHHYFEPKGQGSPFCIMLPPPNVTGSLHMGHGFQMTIMDALTRYHRMIGDKTLWLPGTDHAGISTQLVVERQLDEKGLSKKDMSRETFLNHVWSWKEHSGNRITAQMKRMGASVDWSKERFTMDDGMSQAVLKVFISLYEEGLIYRGTRLVNWDTTLGTAVSDLEVISQEENGYLWHIRYPLTDGSGDVIVATTRPETMLGDVAVAVHPDDLRYQSMIGKEVHLPLTDRTIPIIADDYVDMSFGSGCVKITPAHDFNDYAIGVRHSLPLINILSKRGTLNKQVPLAYQGMDRFVARDRLIADLTTHHYLVNTVPHVLNVPRGEKSNTIIEPLLTDQWYIKMEPLAKPAIEAVKRNEIQFHPDNWTKTYYQWMENIEDWCISRQLWWGHRIPAWYDNHGDVYVGYSEADVRFKYQIDDNIPLKQDDDVLDTWFSSALWPFATLGFPEKTKTLEQFYPTSVLVTGFDIIFFWVARMIMMGLKFTGKVPFKDIIITGLIRDSEGQKMSKSKGNVLDPIDIIDGISLDALLDKRTSSLMLPSIQQRIKKSTEQDFPNGIDAYGTDALRFTYCALASNNRNVRFDMARVEGYRNFCNKLWNASRFVLSNMEEEQSDFDDLPLQYQLQDSFIVSALQKTIQKTHQYFEQFRFDYLANELHDFVWHAYCDWYLESVKTVLYDDTSTPAQKRGTRKTLILVLDAILKLLHPIMPFITETIYQRVNKFIPDASESLMLVHFPEFNPDAIDEAALLQFESLKQMIIAIRTIRSEMNIPPAKKIPLIIQASEDSSFIVNNQGLLKTLAKIATITFIDKKETVNEAASSIVNNIGLFIPLKGLINIEEEKIRLQKDIDKINASLTLIESKLNNPAFAEKAPEAIVLKEKEKYTQLSEAKLALCKQYDNL